MRRFLSRGGALLLAALLLTGCTGGSGGALGEGSAPVPEASAPQQAQSLKTGFALISDTEGSYAHRAQGGAAQVSVTMAAVTVDDEGVIRSCVLDQLQTNLGFDAAGQLTGDPTAPVRTKTELGAEYGMAGASSIGKEWYQQAQAFAQYAVGKRPAKLRNIPINSMGGPEKADLVSSVTISVVDFIRVIEKAAANAQHLGARAGDALTITCQAHMTNSRSAAGDTPGLAQTDITAAALTMAGEEVTSRMEEQTQVQVAFDAAGALVEQEGGGA